MRISDWSSDVCSSDLTLTIGGSSGGFLASKTAMVMAGRPAAVLLMAIALLVSSWAWADPGVLVLGRTSNDPARHYGQLKPLLDYVVPRMADGGIQERRILMAHDVPIMKSSLRRGRSEVPT